MMKTVKLTRYYVLFAMVATAIILTAYFVSPNMNRQHSIMEANVENDPEEKQSPSGITTIEQAMREVQFQESPDKKAELKSFHRMANYGAFVDVKIQVVSENGTPVEGANVILNFWKSCLPIFGAEPVMEVFKFITPTDGRISAKSKTYFGMEWIVEKDGYYRTYGKQSFQHCTSVQGEKAGRWFSGPLDFQVVLRDVRQPIEPISGGGNFRSYELPNGVDVGFDFWANDCVEPYGRGLLTNLVFNIYAMTNDAAERSCLDVKMVDGTLAIHTKEKYVYFAYVYEFPMDEGESILHFSHVAEQVKPEPETELDKNEYIVFSCLDSERKRHYGRIRFLEFGKAWVRFGYDVNPEPNDRNLEFIGR